MQKETICLQAFIVKRSFILNSIASETGHFLEMVQLVHKILSLQLTVFKNKTFKVQTLIKHATYFTHEGSCKKTLCLQAFIVKRSFILNSIASETGHILEMVQLVHRILSLQLTVFENKTFKV